MPNIKRVGIHYTLHYIVHNAPVTHNHMPLSLDSVETLIKLGMVGLISHFPIRYAPTRAGVQRLGHLDEIAIELAVDKCMHRKPRGCYNCGREVTPDALVINHGSCPGCGIA